MRVSRWESWYSGANVATTSIPYDDQHMKYSQTSASASPPLAPMSKLMFELDQSPVMYGQEHQHERRDAQQRAGHVAEPDGRPDAVDVEQPDEHDQPDADHDRQAEVEAAAASRTTSMSENHSAWISVPATSPLTASTTDQPIQ